VSAFAFGAAASANRTRTVGGLTPRSVQMQLDDHASPEAATKIAPLMLSVSDSVEGWFEQCLEAVLDGRATTLAPQET
jgi:hypothetical protein